MNIPEIPGIRSLICLQRHYGMHSVAVTGVCVSYWRWVQHASLDNLHPNAERSWWGNHLIHIWDPKDTPNIKTLNNTSLHITAHHCASLRITAHHCASLHIAAYHQTRCTSLHITADRCISLHITKHGAHHCTSLNITAHHCISPNTLHTAAHRWT